MSENDLRPRRVTERCEYAWCTTHHGATTHPDDETHRSAGAGFPARMRGVEDGGSGTEVDVEVGILRRPGDRENWLVVEAAGAGLVLSLDGARELLHALVHDPGIRAALSS